MTPSYLPQQFNATYPLYSPYPSYPTYSGSYALPFAQSTQSVSQVITQLYSQSPLPYPGSSQIPMHNQEQTQSVGSSSSFQNSNPNTPSGCQNAYSSLGGGGGDCCCCCALKLNKNTLNK